MSWHTKKKLPEKFSLVYIFILFCFFWCSLRSWATDTILLFLQFLSLMSWEKNLFPHIFNTSLEREREKAKSLTRRKLLLMGGFPTYISLNHNGFFSIYVNSKPHSLANYKLSHSHIFISEHFSSFYSINFILEHHVSE